jgi:hypothetical protein
VRGQRGLALPPLDEYEPRGLLQIPVQVVLQCAGFVAGRLDDSLERGAFPASDTILPVLTIPTY